MAANAYGDDQESWMPSDTSTFADQSQNLAKQAGDAGIDEGQINVEKGTAKTEQAAGQTGQNVAAGASAVGKGSQASPTIIPPTGAETAPANAPAQGAPGAGKPTSGIAQPGTQQQTNSAYTTISPPMAAPDTSVTNQVDTSTPTSFNNVDMSYLQKLFPNGVPTSIINAMNATNWNQANPNQAVNYSGNTTMENAMSQYQNILNNDLANQQQGLEQKYNTGMGDIATQTGNAQQAISDYIAKLNQGLSDYQKNTGDLSNIGQLSDSEKNAQQLNAFLANPTTDNATAAEALNQGLTGNSRLAALSGQAQNAAIQKAIGDAGLSQQLDKTGQAELASGQAAQAKGYTDANNAIQTNQTNLLNKLQDNSTAAKKQLNDYYNNSITNLNKQEQDYVNNAQGLIKQNNVPPEKVKAAIQTTANMMSNYLKNNPNMSPQAKQQMKSQLESMWRIGVGSHADNDINHSNQIARSLIPIAQQLQ